VSFVAGRPRLSALLLASAMLAPLSAAAAEVDGTVDGVVVTASPQDYQVKATQAATKLPLSLRETPQSVTVITRQRIEDFGLTSVANVLEQTTGITVQELDSNRVGFSSRGFSISNFQLDGVPTTYNSGNSTMSDTLVYDRVEVVRGATGLVTGSGDPSATVNLIRKAPTPTFSGKFGVTAGSWERYRVEGDVSGPLGFDGKLRGRLVAGFEDTASYIDFYETKKGVALGVLEADITDTTLVRIGYDYQKVTPRGTTWGTVPLFFSDGTPTNLDPSYNVAARWSTWDRDTTNLYGVVEQQLPGDWTLRLSVNDRVSNSTAKLYYGYGGYPDPVTGDGLQVADYFNIYQERETGFDVYASGPLELFGRKHELVIGANGYDREAETENARIDAARRPYPMTISYLNWDGRIPEPVVIDDGTTASVVHTQETGVYGALRLNPTDRLKVILGARSSQYETYTDRYNLAGVFTGKASAYSQDRVTPYVGAILDLTSNISAYVSYSDLFKPQSNKDKNGDQLNPLIGANYEGGLKGEFADGRLYVALVGFYIQQDNLAELDPTVPANFRLPDGSSAYRAVAGAETRGAEAEVVGQVLPGWQLSAGYTYAYTENAAGERINTLNPRNILRISTTYDLGGALEGLTVGGGVNWQSEIYTLATIPTSNTTTIRANVRQEPYALVNLMARYRVNRHVEVSANVDNLFDETYYRRVGFYNGGYFGEPRKVTVAVRTRF
jgi:outer membrane receptor for ferric coprogen and ferric-rhodotorulic acid